MKSLVSITPQQFERAARIRQEISDLEKELGSIFGTGSTTKPTAPDRSSLDGAAIGNGAVTRARKTVTRHWSPEARAKAARKMKARWKAIRAGMNTAGKKSAKAA